jgi:hypothetical protein
MIVLPYYYGGFVFNLCYSCPIPPRIGPWGETLEEGEPAEVEVDSVVNSTGQLVEVPAFIEEEAIEDFFRWVESTKKELYEIQSEN